MKGTQFDEMTAFVGVATHRSFARAARQLGISTTVASRRIAALESRLGTRLLNRTTRSVSPTEAGAQLLADLAPAVAGLDAAYERAAGRDRDPHGRLRINLPRVAARCVLAPMMAAFAERFPQIEIDLVIDDHLRDVVADGFDAGIRLGDAVQRDMIAVRLSPDFRMAVVGSPAYLKERPHPRVPADLLGHRCLTYRFAESGLLQRWSFDDGSGPIVIDPPGVLAVNETDALLTAAVDGMGLAYLGELLVRDHVEAGALVALMCDWCRPLPGFHLYHPSRRLTPPPLRAFIEFVQERQTRRRGGGVNQPAAPVLQLPADRD